MATRRRIQPVRWIKAFATQGNKQLAEQLKRLEESTYSAIEASLRVVDTVTGKNLGSGARVFAKKLSPYLRFRTLRGTGDVTVSENADGLHIDVSSALTGESLGTGAEVFAGKDEANLQFRSFTGSNGITVTEGATEIDHAYNEPNTLVLEPGTGTFTAYEPTGWAELRFVYLDGLGARTFHGFKRPTAGRANTKTFVIPNGVTVGFVSESGSAAAADRLQMLQTNGTTRTIQGPNAITFQYDETGDRWRPFAIYGEAKNLLLTDSATGAQNNYEPTSWHESRFIDLSGAAPVFTGFAEPRVGGVKMKTFLIRAGNTATFKENDAGSTAGNRLSMPWESDIVVEGPATVTLDYQDHSSWWRMIVPNVKPVKTQVTVSIVDTDGQTALDWYRYTGLSCPGVLPGKAVALSPNTAHQVASGGGTSNLWSALGSCLTADELDVTIYGNCTCGTTDWVLDVSQ